MSYRFRTACIVLAIVCCAQTRAASLRATVDSLQAHGVDVKNIEIEIDSDAEGGQDLQLRAAQLRWPEFDLQLSELHAQCPLESEAGSWRCAGQAQLRVAAAAKPAEAGFVATLERGRLNLQLNRAPARLTLSQPGDDAAPRWQLQLRQLPLDWLSDLLRASWPALSRVEGQLAVDAELLPSATAPLHLDYSLRDLG